MRVTQCQRVRRVSRCTGIARAKSPIDWRTYDLLDAESKQAAAGCRSSMSRTTHCLHCKGLSASRLKYGRILGSKSIGTVTPPGERWHDRDRRSLQIPGGQGTRSHVDVRARRAFHLLQQGLARLHWTVL